MRRRSAGTCRPASRITRSPGTRPAASISLCSPPRTTTARSRVICFKDSTAFSAFPSWITPTTPFNVTTARITAASPHSPNITEITAAASRTKINESQSWSMKRFAIDRRGGSSSSFLPYVCRRASASAWVRPSPREISGLWLSVLWLSLILPAPFPFMMVLV